MRVPLMALALLALVAMAAPRAFAVAETVTIEHLGLDLVGNVEVAPGRTLAADGVVLIVHGTLLHHGAEVIAALQTNLAARGVSSLAITLSLGLNGRQAALDCSVEHDHRHSDAVEEIAAWVEWLQSNGVSRIAIAGHSRGAAQVALYAAMAASGTEVDLYLLLAPLTDEPARVASAYKATHGADLDTIIEQAKERVAAGEGSALFAVPGFLYCRDARTTAEAFLDYYGPDTVRHTPALLKSIDKQVLVVVAGADELFPDLPKALEAEGSLPHVTVTTIDGSDHFFRDLYGEDLADIIVSEWKK